MSIESVLAAAVAEGNLVGAVAMVGDRDGVGEVTAVGERGGGAAMTPDTIFQLASMTKAITSVAAMQLVEAGKLALDAPIGDLLPRLAAPQVITGFDADGAVQLRPAARPVTLRHLLTHTSGIGYDFVQEATQRARAAAPPAAGSLAWLEAPLLFDPGDDWAYGMSTDWVGLAVEAASGQRLDAYFAEHIFAPLGMVNTGFALTPAQQARQAALMMRGPDGLAPLPITIGGGTEAEFLSGGGGLLGTGGDYLRFLRMLLNGGSLDGATILSAASVAEMTRNQIGGLHAGRMTTTGPGFSLAVDWFPGMTPGWGLGFMINPEPGTDGRAAGSLAWAGVANTYFWIDPGNGIAALLLMQLLPFADPAALAALSAFERAVYTPG